jgi:Flp pilus assembly protein TadG
MAMANAIKNAVARFSELRFNKSGNVLAMMAAGMLPTIAAIGSAVDLARIYMVTIQMQSGVDAAALAGAKAFGNQSSTGQGRLQQVQTYFAENYLMDQVSGVRPTVIPRFETRDGRNVTTVTSTIDLPMVFMQIFGTTTRRIEVRAVAELRPKPIEVMVVLDNTGSMLATDVGGGSRMDALKQAMRTFTDTLHQGASSRPELAMGFVTYNVTTNVGAILADAGVRIQNIDGYTNVSNYTGGVNGRANPLGWMGCVENDVSVRDVSSDPTQFEDGAFDIRATLPGEVVNGRTMPPIRPYLYPPSSRLRTHAHTFSAGPRVATDFFPEHLQSDRGNGRSNNHYILSPNNDHTIGERLANTSAYRHFFYDFYIGLNANTSNTADDVIVRPDGGYYDPALGRNGAWVVNYTNVPYLNDTRVWGQPNPIYGYPIPSNTRAPSNLNMAQPNWQCPEPAMPIQYGRAKQAYLDYINNENHPVMPASGTLHHIGFLWGYRILARDDVFRRSNPVIGEEPIKALVFMTDGETSVNSAQHWYGAYGALRERRISSNSTSTNAFETQIMRRFSKVCQAAKSDGITVYIVSLKANVGEFSTCAGSRYRRTEDANTIQQAFQEIAVDLVDLHLTQ